jgi:hypothetical protein
MKSCRFVSASTISVVVLVSTVSRGQDRHWILPTNGSWAAPANWSPADVPDTAAENAIFDLVGTYTALYSGNVGIGSLVLASGAGSLHISSGSMLSISTGISNDSTIALNPSGGSSDTHLRAMGSWSVAGPGRLMLSAHPGNLMSAALTGNTGSEVVSNNAGHTISGTGVIAVQLNNNATIAADVNTRVLLLSGGAKVNNGVLSATGGGILRLEASITQGATGQIVADGGVVQLQGTTITGGSLQTLGAGEAAVTVSSTVIGLTNSGTLKVQPLTILNMLGGDLTNNGTIAVNPTVSSSDTYLRARSSITLAGSGQVMLSAHQGNLNSAALVWDTGTEVVTNSANHTIRGTGSVTVQLVNQGHVIADWPDRYLRINGGTKTNSNTFSAVNDGILYLDAVTIQQDANGRLFADNGIVDFHGASVTGGRLDAAGTGFGRVSGTSTLSSFYNNAPLHVLPTNILNIAGSLANNGSIVVNPNTSSSDTWVRATAGPIVLSGIGEIVLNAYPGSLNSAALVDLGGLEYFVNAPSHTIRGTGHIAVKLVNGGTVAADHASRTLLLSQEPKSNDALMKASNSGTLSIQTAVNQGAQGRILAENGSVQFQGATISQGFLDAAGTGSMQVLTSSTFTNITNNAPISVMPLSTLSINGPTLTNNGSIAVNPNRSSSDTWVRVSTPTVTLAGTGEIVLTAHPGNLNSAALVWMNGDETFINAPTHTIRSTGNISAQLINNGAVRADESARTLLLSQGGKTNNATIAATNGGTLLVQTAVTQGPTGRLLADNGSISLHTATITGGSIESLQGGAATVVATSTLSGVTNAASLNVSPLTELRVVGPTFVNNGALLVNPSRSSSDTYVRLSGNLTLAGTGSITLNAHTGNYNSGAIFGMVGNEVLTNAPTHTIAGVGQFHVALSNQGAIAPGTAAAAGQIRGSAVPLTNTGVLDFDLFGSTTYDRIVTTGPITLGGTLTARLAPGYAKGTGAYLTIIQGASITGTFSTYNLPERLTPVYSATQVRLLDPCESDLDDGSNTGHPDAAVNIDDLLFFLEAFEAGTLPADLDNGSMTGTHDQAVTIEDLLYFLVRFEMGC